MLPSISISSTVSIPTYFLFISVAAVLALFWTQKRAPLYQVSVARSLDLCLVVFVSGFFGGRLFHIFYEEPAYYIQDPLKIFYFWDGGFVYYGGFLAALLASGIFLYKTDRTNWKTYFDLATPILSLSYIIGRLACFMAGCCFGKTCELPWAVRGLHPTQLYAIFMEALLLGIILWLENGQRKMPANSSNQKLFSGDIFLLWVQGHALSRIIMEAFRDDFRGAIYFMSISAWISTVLFIIAAVIFIRRHLKAA